MTTQTPDVKYRRDLWRLLPARARIAEVGVAEARFSEEMMCWPIYVEMLYLVDAWTTLPGTGDGAFPQSWHDSNYQVCMGRMSKYKDRVTILRGFSARMASHVPDASLDLAYLDAAHDYENFVADNLAWYPKVKHGGILAGHDFENPAYGVKRGAEEFAARHGLNLIVMPEDKPEDAGFYFRKP